MWWRLIDRATIVGIAATLALIAWACHGAANALDAFWQTSSVVLVVGGAAFTSLISSPGTRFRSIGRVVKSAVTVRTRPPEELVAKLVELAHTARRDGLLALEKPVELLEDDFLKRAMRMAVDGADARTIEQVCRTELECTDLRHDRDAHRAGRHAGPGRRSVEDRPWYVGCPSDHSIWAGGCARLLSPA